MTRQLILGKGSYTLLPPEIGRDYFLTWLLNTLMLNTLAPTIGSSFTKLATEMQTLSALCEHFLA